MQEENELVESPVSDGRHGEKTGDVQRTANKKRMVIEICIYVMALFFAAVIVPKYLLQRTVVIGNSMENTLYDGDNIWVEKVSYHFDKLKRFDVIVFYPNGKDEDEYYVKRIIGMPGETVQIVGDTIYIDGVPLSEHFGKEPITYAGIAEEEILLGAEEYFVLGDNRTISLDSRYEKVGPVKKENIGGNIESNCLKKRFYA